LISFTNYFFIRSQGESQADLGDWPGRGLQPSDLLKAYGFPASEGGGALAIVDAYHYPNLKSDLDKFSAQFSLPVLPNCPDVNPYTSGPCIKVVPYAGAEVNCGWNGEAALDVQWAHAIAPKATLIFVEADTENNGALFDAVKTAIAELKKAGGGTLSLSWGGGETSTEAQDYDVLFVNGSLYVVSSGDVGGEISYPASSPNVISVGGTGLKLTAGQPLIEYGWEDSGGGQSQYEPLPPYQQNIENIIGNKRNIPDIAADADTRSGVAMYVSTTRDVCSDHPDPNDWKSGWQVTGGTSVAAPVVAAMINVAGRHRTSVPDELSAIYGNRKNPKRIRDITLMFLSAGGNMTKIGYDNVTGVGAPASVDFDAAP
jgi:subtilase family serine protease